MSSSSFSQDVSKLKGSDFNPTTIHTETQQTSGGIGQTHRVLKSRHIVFIGIGSGIGTGLFVGTGAALANAGPLGLLLAFIVVGCILYSVMQAIGELATLIPTAGTFPHFATRFLSPGVGFALGINYFYCYAIAIASELSAAATLVGYWTDLSPAATISVGLVAVIAINSFSVRYFGESEVISASIKVITFLGLIIIGIILDLGGGPNHDRLGFRYWKAPWGPFAPYPGVEGGSKANFLAFFSAFVNAAFTYIGTECVVLGAGEAKNPTKAIPKATRRVLWRIVFFYIIGALLVGMLVPYDDPRLVSGTGNANSSPWVIAIRNAGIPALPSIVNAAILTSAWSAGNSYLFVSSRVLVGMSIDGQLPACFSRVNKSGVPYYSVAFSALFGLFAYLSCGSGGPSQAFTWLLTLSTVAGLIAWATLCLCFIRFEKACRAQGVDRNTLPFKSPFQPYSAWFGFVGSVIITIFQGFSVFIKGNWSASSFISSYIGIPLFFVPLLVWHIYHKNTFVSADKIDLWTGRIEVEDEVDEPEPTTWVGKLLDKLL